MRSIPHISKNSEDVAPPTKLGHPVYQYTTYTDNGKTCMLLFNIFYQNVDYQHSPVGFDWKQMEEQVEKGETNTSNVEPAFRWKGMNLF